MEKLILEAFQLSPAALELEQPGYLHPEEVNELKLARMHFGSRCEDIALRYLKLHPSPAEAKIVARADIKRLQANTTPDDPSVDLSPLFQIVLNEVDLAIARMAAKNAFERAATRTMLKVPGLIRIGALALFVIVAVIAGRQMITR